VPPIIKWGAKPFLAPNNPEENFLNIEKSNKRQKIKYYQELIGKSQ